MTDSFITHAHPFSDGQVRLATANYESQEWLTRELHGAFLTSGMTVRELADELELTPDEAASWLSGDVNLSLADLRHLATAMDAHVTYRVESAVNRMPEWIATLAGDGWSFIEHAWNVDRRRL